MTQLHLPARANRKGPVSRKAFTPSFATARAGESHPREHSLAGSADTPRMRTVIITVRHQTSCRARRIDGPWSPPIAFG
jgi:hypothetical protein